MEIRIATATSFPNTSHPPDLQLLHPEPEIKDAPTTYIRENFPKTNVNSEKRGAVLELLIFNQQR